ncbi:MAG: glycosyltransferase, partial [Oscillospiraceae bacterium]
ATDNLIFLDPVAHDALLPLLERADLLWISTRPLAIYRYGLAMNKLFDYMSAGRPILLGASGGGEDPVSRAGCGAVVAPDDLDAMARAVETVRTMHPDARRALGESGARYVREHHFYPRLAAQYRSFLEELSDAIKKRQ